MMSRRISVIVVLLILTVTLSAAAEPVKVDRLGEKDLRRLVTGLKGKVVFINVWATWCKPCREEFPDLIQLAANYKDEKDVAFVSISADYPDETKTKILPFLGKFDVNFPVYVQDFRDPQDFINLLNRKWNGALPATFIFDAEGKQRSLIVGKRDFHSFKEEIEKVRRPRRSLRVARTNGKGGY